MVAPLLDQVFVLHTELFLNEGWPCFHFLDATVVHFLYFPHFNLTILLLEDWRWRTTLHLFQFLRRFVNWHIRPNILERYWLLLVWRFLRCHWSLEAEKVTMLVNVKLAAWLLDLGSDALWLSLMLRLLIDIFELLGRLHCVVWCEVRLGQVLLAELNFRIWVHAAFPILACNGLPKMRFTHCLRLASINCSFNTTWSLIF